MIDVSLQGGVIALFVIASVVLGISTGLTIALAVHLSGAKDTPAIALGIFTGMLGALGWFLALVGIYDIGGPLVLKVSEGGAWGLAFAALAGGITFGLTAGMLAWHAAYTERGDDEEANKQAEKRAADVAWFWGLGVFTVSSFGWFALLLWLFNGHHVVH